MLSSDQRFVASFFLGNQRSKIVGAANYNQGRDVDQLILLKGEFYGHGLNNSGTAMNLVQIVVLEPGSYSLTFRVWGSSQTQIHGAGA